MSQQHSQFGTFHATTNARAKIPWLTSLGVPELIIDNLLMTKNMHQVKVFAFCILPDHMHILMEPGDKGLSAFMHSLKRNTMRDMRKISPAAEVRNFRDQTQERGRCGSSASVAENMPHCAWQKGFFDERIRDSRQRSAAFHYVQGNAMKHELVYDIADWPWTSIHFAHLLDPMEIWID